MEYDLSSGDPYIWQEWYSEKEISIEAKVSCVYQLEQPREGQIEAAIRSFHSHHGHTINTGTKIITGLGSTQVILGLIYAFTCCLKKVRFYEQSPHCAIHKDLVHLCGQEWVSTFKQGMSIQPHIEFVTSPNNPDGSVNVPITSAPIILWDAVYAWPWYGFTLPKLLSHMKKACNKRMCIPIFSFSKSLGLAGQRVGYALIPPSVQKEYPSLITHYQHYINVTTQGTCRPGEGICRVIATSYKEFPLITERLEQRYDVVSLKLKELLPNVEILSPRGFPYMWIRHPNTDLYAKLLTFGIKGTPGDNFGSSKEYVRLSLLISSHTLNQILAIKI